MVKSKPSGSKKQLFDPESESSDGECSRDSDALEDTLSSAALNFGWHKLHEAAKARFAKEVSAAGKQEKPKRHYDNSKRDPGKKLKNLRQNLREPRKLRKVWGGDSPPVMARGV